MGDDFWVTGGERGCKEARVSVMKSTLCLCPQGFLSDLLEKANRHYDEQKLQEYTQTIVRLQTQPHELGETGQTLLSIENRKLIIL